MKYYAVTDDPNELLHYGVKGMKWGQHIFGDKPRSAGYRRAAAKLRGLSRTQKAANKRAKEQNKYTEAVKRAQKKISSTVTKLNDVYQDKKYYHQINHDLRRDRQMANNLAKIERYKREAEANVIKQQARHMKRALKVDKKFDRILQQAREGRLRYGKLNDEQIKRVQDRLAREEQARKLGGKETMSFHRRKKEARQEGRLLGIKEGTKTAMTEVAKATTQYGVTHLMNRMALKNAQRTAGKYERVRKRAKERQTAHEVAQEIRDNARKEKVRNGEGLIKRNNPIYFKETDLGGLLSKPRAVPWIDTNRLPTTKSALKYLSAAKKSGGKSPTPEGKVNMADRHYTKVVTKEKKRASAFAAFNSMRENPKPPVFKVTPVDRVVDAIINVDKKRQRRKEKKVSLNLKG